MARVAIDRHGMSINVVFAQGAARTVPLREIYGLSWSKVFDKTAGFPIP